MPIDKNLLALLLPVAAAFGGDLLPLQSGNQWTYRDLSSGESFAVRVGSPLAANGQVYYRLMGYAGRALWVRALNDGTLVYLDEEAGAERVLTSFEDGAGWAEAPFRPCDQESRQEGEPAPYNGAAGWFPSSRRLAYRAFGCAEAGVESEVYVAGFGMMRRTVTTIAGPREYELVSARVGRFMFDAAPATTFSVSVAENPARGLSASMRLALGAGELVDLYYPDWQEFDFVIWDEAGKPVYRWSDGKAFAQAVRTRSVSGELRHDVPAELLGPLPDGRYVLEAWLTTGPGRRGYAAMAPFRIEAGSLIR